MTRNSFIKACSTYRFNLHNVLKENTPVESRNCNTPCKFIHRGRVHVGLSGLKFLDRTNAESIGVIDQHNNRAIF